MGEKDKNNNPVERVWGDIVRTYCELMDEVMPYLTPAEQVVYQRLFRLSHVQQRPLAKYRYEELAAQCGLSLRTLQRALKGLRQKQLVSTAWQSHGTTTFTVRLLSQLPRRPAFLPRKKRAEFPSPPLSRPVRPPVYDAFSPEDRNLFLTCKRGLSPARLNALTEEAVEWLTERAAGDPTAFSDEALRDKVDELVFSEVFGFERRERYQHLFDHLYQKDR
ncbi:MAG TPA: hypothetical protein VGX03_35015 [Candidatus Binatia bacterium]|nr:hypothetical protein [Candidatus Binatia bacterium]